MEQVLEAVYSGGVLKPLTKLDLPENQRVHLILSVPDAEESTQALQAWHEVYAGLSADDIAEIEAVALDRTHFVEPQS